MYLSRVIQGGIWFAALLAVSRALLSGGRNVCTFTDAVWYSIPYRHYYDCGNWLLPKTCSETRHHTGYKVRANNICCDGWISEDGNHCDTALCFGLRAGSCPNGGNCKGPDLCSCPPGYSPPACNETDECALGNGGCEDTCINTHGSYLCECRNKGFGLAEDGFSCKAICFDHQPGVCPNGGECIEPNFCYCLPGFDSKENCSDIDECNSGVSRCDQHCVNTQGSYQCACDTGYSLANNSRTCLPLCGESPPGTCANGGRCVSPENCDCLAGYQSPNCTDIDECILSNGGCEEICINSPGSYRCDCRIGFGLVGNTSCLPVCLELSPGRCPNGGICRSPESCECQQGFVGDQCSDINECLTANGGCEQKCQNTPGSHDCICFSGYRLLSDGVTCEDINECQDKNGGCDHSCENGIGFYNCSCDEGFELDTDGRTCNDTDECQDHPDFCQQECVNMPGSFACTCPTGYKLERDRSTCIDVDECASSNGGCHDICVNSESSFQCKCQQGYNLGLDGSSCEDIDECLENKGNCSDLCINDPGSFHCDCLAGYTLKPDEVSCTDIDECVESNGGCQHVCSNTIGSWVCSCSDGFLLGADGLACQDASRCPFNGNINCWLMCTPTPNDTCKCPDDTILHTDGNHCINPCYSSPCFNGGKCHLAESSFWCDCDDTGYTGELCLHGVVSFPDDVRARAGVVSDTYTIRISPKRQVLLYAGPNNYTKVFPNPVVITHPDTSASFQVLSKSRGLHVVTWNASGSDAEYYTNIPPLRVLTEDVFTRLQLLGDVLPKGCFQLSIPFHDNIIHLFSTQPWYRLKSNEKTQFTQGVVFFESTNSSLPVSESGLEVVVISGKLLFGPVSLKRQVSDGEVISDTVSTICQAISMSKQDYTEFSAKNSLLRSILREFGNILPDWLTFSLDTASSYLRQFTAHVTQGRNLQRYPSCNGAPVFDGDIYYVMRIKGSFIMSLAGESVPMSNPNDGSEEFCFIIGLHNDKTFVVMFPSQVSDLLQSVSIFNSLKEENVIAYPRGIGISFSGRLNSWQKRSEITFWNGEELFQHHPAKDASVWFATDLKKTATGTTDYSLNAQGDVFMSVPDVRKMFTHMLSDPWTALLQIDAGFDLVLTFLIFNEECTITLKDVVELKASALTSVGGQDERQYCGPNANPPGFFIAASIDATLLRDWPAISNFVFSLNVRGYFFRILDSTYIDNTEKLQAGFMTDVAIIKNMLSNFSDYLSLLSQTRAARLESKVQRVKLLLVEVSGDITDSLSTRHQSNELDSQLFFDLTGRVSELAKRVEYIAEHVSLDLSDDWSRFSQMVVHFVENIRSKANDMQINFVRQLNAVITGGGSWGVKGQFSVTLLGKDFMFGAEMVTADKNIGYCGKFSDIYQELSEEKVVRVTGYVDTEIEIKAVSVAVKTPVNVVWEFCLTIDGGAFEMALAQNSNKFVVRLEVIASFLGVELSTNLFIRDTGISSVMEADVWGIFRTRLLMSADIFVPPSQMALRVQGLFLPGGRSFDGSFGDAVRMFAKQLGNIAIKRLEQAKEAVKAGKKKVTEAQSWLDEKKRILDNANEVFDKSVAALERAQQRLEDAKEPFQTALEAVKAAKKRIDDLCTIQTCSSICIPGLKIRICYITLWFITLPYPCIETTGCMFRIPDPICLVTNSACSVVRSLAYAALEVAEIAVRIPLAAFDLSKEAVSVAQIVVDKSRVLIEVAKVPFDLAILTLEAVKVTLDAANVALHAVEFAVKLAADVFDFLVQFGLQKVIDIKQCGFDQKFSTRNVVEFEVFCELNLFSLGWRKIGFKINFRHLVNSLWNAAKAVVEGVLDEIGGLLGRKKREVDFIINARLHKEYRRSRQPDTTDNEQSPTMTTNNTIELSPFDVNAFWRKQCSIYGPVWNFLRQGMDNLRIVAAEMEKQANVVSSNSSYVQGLFKGMPNLTVESVGINLDIATEDFNLTRGDLEKALNETEPEDDDVLSESKNAAQFIIRQNNEATEGMLGYQIVPVWKAEMENLTRGIFNATDCTGFHDCVVHSFGELYQLLDSVDPNLVTMARNFLPGLESAYFELLGNNTRGVIDVKNVTSEMLNLVDRIDVSDIFCGSAPLILESPVNVTAMKGSDVVLSCRAESVPRPTYYWYRNSQILAIGENLTTIEISGISSADEGEYTCMAGNHIDNTTAETAHLSMVYPAEITSSLPEILEVLTGTQVSMTCSHVGKPVPTISWHSTSKLFNVDQNKPSVLTLTAVQNGMSGLYACEASNVYGRVQSAESTLNVFDGKPICPQLDILLGYLTSSTTDSDTILSDAEIQPSSVEEAMVDAVSLLAKGNDTGVELSVEQVDVDIIQLSISVNCKSNQICSEHTCRKEYTNLLEKVQGVWTRLQTNLDSTKALFTLSGTTYFCNPSIAELTGMENKCPSGYRQLLEFACVNEADRYILPAPIIDDWLQSTFANVSWKTEPQVERFVRGYTVVLQTRPEYDILLNTTTTSTVYDVSLHLSSGTEHTGYEIWVRAFTASHRSHWAKKVLLRKGKEIHDGNEDATRLNLVLGLSLGILGSVCVLVGVGCVLYRRVLKHRYGFVNFSDLRSKVTARLLRYRTRRNEEIEMKDEDEEKENANGE